MTQPAPEQIVPHEDWLDQGDIFASVPIVRVDENGETGVTFGAALLVTRGCVLDKKRGDGRPQTEHVNFLPIQDLAQVQAINAGKAANLRGSVGQLRPYGTLFLGAVAGVCDEAYVMLSSIYTIPVSLIGAELRTFAAGVTGGDSDDDRLVATAHGERIGRLSQPQLDLLERKWFAHWFEADPEFLA